MSENLLAEHARGFAKGNAYVDVQTPKGKRDAATPWLLYQDRDSKHKAAREDLEGLLARRPSVRGLVLPQEAV